MTAKLPTNSDLGKKLDKVIREVTDMNVILLKHDNSIHILEGLEHDRKLIADTTKEIKAQDEQDRQNRLKDVGLQTRNQIWTKVLMILGIIAAILTAYAASRGIK